MEMICPAWMKDKYEWYEKHQEDRSTQKNVLELNRENISKKINYHLCDPMDCSMPGFPVLHYLLDFAQTHVH